MKKRILIFIGVFLAIIIISIILFFKFSNKNFTNNLVTVSKIILESFIAGIVAFGGLYFTFMFQEEKDKISYDEEVCPLFIIKAQTMPTAESNICSERRDNEVCDGKGEEKIRKVDCKLNNAKKNVALNAELLMINSNEKIQIEDDITVKLFLLSSGEHKISFYFEDIYGRTYKQIVVYEYQNNSYHFKYNQPIRRTTNDKH